MLAGYCQTFPTTRTDAGVDYTFIPKIPSRVESFTFKVRANALVNLALTERAQMDDGYSSYVEIREFSNASSVCLRELPWWFVYLREAQSDGTKDCSRAFIIDCCCNALVISIYQAIQLQSNNRSKITEIKKQSSNL